MTSSTTVGQNTTKFQGFDHPEPKAYEVPYKNRPESKNPVVRGVLLQYGSRLVASSPAIARYLYKNAGFSRLGALKGIEDVEPRYNPAVIPASVAGDLFDIEKLEQLRHQQCQSPSLYPNVLAYHKAYKNGDTTPIDVARVILSAIKDNARHAPAFLQVQEQQVLEAAEASTKRYQSGTSLGLLDGIPVAVKDQVAVTGYKTTVGMKRDVSKGGTSWCVQQWLDVGAVCIGKVSMHELGLDTTNNNPNFGTPLNPFNDKYYTGGSSGGSGYVVGCGICPIALGADGGGSIRVPSSFCGIFGLKTTHDRVSGLPSPRSARSTGVIGPMAANMIDLELAYKVMAQPNPGDPHSAPFPGPKQSVDNSARVKKIGVCQQWFDRADPKVKEACNSAIAWMKQSREYEVVDIKIPYLNEGQVAHAITILSEIATSHRDVSDLTAANKILISVALQATALDLVNAQKLRNVLMRHLASIWQEHPGLMLATPTTPNAGWPIQKPADLVHGCTDANRSVRTMEYVWLANFTGIPSLTAPVAYQNPVKGSGDIPVGLMLMGEWASEDNLIEAGYELETYLTDVVKGGRQRPDLWVDTLGNSPSTSKS